MKIAFALLLGIAATCAAAAEIDDKVDAALADDIRTEDERERDRNRRPLQTLKFFGLTDDMDVLELIPGGGWYTKVLAPVLAENGSLTLSLFHNTARSIADEAGWPVDVIETGAVSRPEGARHPTLADVDFGSEKFDMVLTFRNLHNFDAAGRRNMNEAAFRALRPGGHYGVVDHTRRHMQADTDENRRRLDPVLAIKEILEAGFEFVDYSSLHYRPDDELVYEVGRRTVTGNTDRFTLLFRRPDTGSAE